MIYRNSLLDRLERKFGRFSISNLMTVMVGAMAIVYIMGLLIEPRTGISLTGALMFDRSLILSGQIWRLFTFVFLPPSRSAIWIFLSLYFYWSLGTALEAQWGAFRFNLFYLCGMLCTVIGGFITGYALNDYINLSLFLAYAILFPDATFHLFFVIEIKAKYMAIAYLIILVLLLVGSPFSHILAAIISLGNVILFLWPRIRSEYKRLRMNWRYKHRK